MDTKRAVSYLKKDKKLAELIDKYGADSFVSYYSNPQDPDLFLDLVEIVVGQQLSMKAADSIFKRFKALFAGKITPKKLLAIEHDLLRGVGLSNSKAKYIKNIAEYVLEQKEFQKVGALSDNEIHAFLTKIKGIGPWSVDMFLMFTLKREDVFSMGDLGLRTAVSRVYGVDREDTKAIEKIAKKWKPYRTLASRYLWKSLENT